MRPPCKYISYYIKKKSNLHKAAYFLEIHCDIKFRDPTLNGTSATPQKLVWTHVGITDGEEFREVPR
jgi:hypothetical protein